MVFLLVFRMRLYTVYMARIILHKLLRIEIYVHDDDSIDDSTERTKIQVQMKQYRLSVA